MNDKLSALPEGCPEVAHYSGGFINLTPEKAKGWKSIPVEIHTEGTRARLAGMLEFIEEEAGLDCDNSGPLNPAPCNACASCRARAFLAGSASSPKGWEPMESLGEIRKTERGFERISFRDRNGERCDLQQSSAAEYILPGSSAVWLGTAGNRMHLGVDMVKALIGHLSSWLDKNTFGPACPGEAQTNKEA